ncbi:hypothetical protein AQUCO_02700053v1 [Aquilegia coerulea]|uniref:Uncharacterized protein n=1 Tax=Aquilegia coerulea TaxID=218851 RepID=A0A2G5D4X7_AQUCA|nr:hypothetical protein AQUCO_02700053v1 [Aquilegia coerulea]
MNFNILIFFFFFFSHYYHHYYSFSYYLSRFFTQLSFLNDFNDIDDLKEIKVKITSEEILNKARNHNI